MNTLDLLKKIGADFEVEKRDMYFHPNDDDRYFKLVPRYCAIVRTDTCVPLSVMGDEYGVVQYKDTISFLDEIIAEGSVTIKHGYIIDQGAKLYIMMKGNEAITLCPGEQIESTFIVSTSHDGTGAIRIMYAPTYAPLNVILTPLGKGELRMRHKVHINEHVKNAKVAIRRIFNYTNTYRNSFKQLVNIQPTEEQARTYFKMVIEGESTRAENIKAKIFDLWLTSPLTSNFASCKATLFGCLMAVAQFADYYKVVRKSKIRSDDDARIYSSLDGEGAKMKAEALSWAISCADKGFIGKR